MGDIADMMLDGTLCEGCGAYLDDAPGLPGRCAGCRNDDDRPAPAQKAKLPKPTAKPGKPQEPLPNWKLDSPSNTSVRYHCNFCKFHSSSEQGADDHVRALHGRAA